MGKTKNTYYSQTREVLDLTTGEVARLETTKRHKITIESDGFYMVFIDYVAPIFKLTNGTAKSVLSWLCCHAQFNTGRVSISQADRKEIMDSLDISKNTLSRSLNELCQKKLLKGERGTYIINPFLFWKGDLKSRNALLDAEEIQISFSIEPKSVGCEDQGGEITEIIPNEEFAV